MGNIILIVRPLGHWDIMSAELRRVAALGRYMEPMAAVKAQWIADDDDALRQIASLCEELQADGIYTCYANKKLFRHTEDFWASGDNAALRQHVKRRCDERLLDAVALAWQHDIPMLFQPSDGTALHIDDRLTLTPGDMATPVMSFRRHDQGISYRLMLRTADGTTIDDLSSHSLTVLGHEPGLFIMDRRLMVLAEGFSGKLLLPFTTKSTVEIPRRIENDYMRRFILRNVALAEIEAEGFDISDTGDRCVPCLHSEKSLDGSPLLTLRFRYGDSVYTPGGKQNGRVTLTATADGGFRFTRQMRDRVQERKYARQLAKLTPRKPSSAPSGILRFDTTEAMVAWLRDNAPALRKKGFDVVQPKDSMYYIGPMDVEQSDTWRGDWLQTDVTVVLDGGRLRVPFTDLRDTILRGEQVYMLPTGELLLIPPEWLKRYAPLLLLGMAKGKAFQRHRSQLVEDEAAGEDLEAGGHAPSHGRDLATAPSSPSSVIAAPAGLRATLRPYQLTGYSWLWGNFEAQTGCCLSDEMGLGKTLQTIALLLKYKEDCKALGDDRREVGGERPPGGLKPQPGFLFTDEEMRGEVSGVPQKPFRTCLVVAPASVVHNWRAELSRFAPSLTVCTYTGTAASRRDMRDALMRHDVVITAYRTMANDIDYLADQQFGIAVFDESQAFKTATSQLHRAVVRLQALHRIALSGTPVENSLMELWSLMNVLTPPLLGSQRSFRESFVAPIARQIEDERTTLLQRLIAPYFLKRTKEEVLTDLPSRQDEVVVCPMTDDQARRYAEELSSARNELLAATSQSSPLAPQSSPLTEQQRFHLLAALQRLRHIANGEGKINALFDHLEALRGTTHKVLIFSEYVTMLDRVATEMHRRSWTYDLLTGHTRDRQQVISHFQHDAQCQFFLISLKAGGVGLNLTAADYVMLVDPWWNQAAEEQAIARAHRIGQQQPVFVYRFVSENTLEEQILTLQERKQTLIDSVMPFLANDKKYKTKVKKAYQGTNKC